MSDLLAHVIVVIAPMLISGASLRRSAVAGVGAITPDLDVFFLVHRSPSHSYVATGALLGLAILLARLLRRRRIALAAALILLGMATHITLDLFTTFTPAFWPLYAKSIWVELGSEATISSLGSIAGRFDARWNEKPTDFIELESPIGSAFTGESAALAVAVLLGIAVRAFLSRKKKRAHD